MKHNQTPDVSLSLFGTDGIRGTPGTYPLTNEMITRIGYAIAQFSLMLKHKKKTIPCIVIGKDTRLSGGHLEKLLSDAITSSGVDVLIAGTITTPGLSFLTKDLGAQMGIMISASHNKPTDNGIKFFGPMGYKLLPQQEKEIEEIILDIPIHPEKPVFSHSGKSHVIKDVNKRYLDFLKSTTHGLDLKGMRIALDCAYGATALFAKQLFTDLGAEVHAINDLPQGENINCGGTMAPKLLQQMVKENSFCLGIAFDGDGDRGMVIDDTGNILDGDHILAVVSTHLLQKNKLPKNSIVATVMSNLGLKNTVEYAGGKIIFTQVGDKHVLESLIQNNLDIGGEQSGHIIFRQYLPTPDGMLTALQILMVMKEKAKSLSELKKCMSKYPQVLVNIKVREKKPFEEIPLITEKLDDFNTRLAGEGRIFLRYSGTESLARVMVEGKNEDFIKTIAYTLAEHIKEDIGV